MNSIVLLSQFLPILVLVLLGALFGKRGLFTEAMIEGFKRIVTSISLPALLFLAFSHISVEGRLWFLALAVFASCALFGILAHLPVRFLALPRTSTMFLFQGFEAGMLGYALFTTLYGTKALPAFASADLGQVLYVFTVLMFQLKREDIPISSQPHSAAEQSRQRDKKKVDAALIKIVVFMLSSPVIIAILVGLLSSTFVPSAKGLPWAEDGFLYPLLSTLGSMTTPLVSIVVGFGLRDLSLDSLGKSFVLIISRLSAVILVGLSIIMFVLPVLGYGSLQALALMTLFILPPPFIIPVFKKSDEDTSYISTVLSLYTLVSIVLAFIIALIWGSGKGGLL
ncbi:AEC family transporter [Gracilinema caldarium]|uniref:AEC family transporter n=1 Tax=Gracilinema caldarium TaxID=215591 RepID=UPI0026EBF48C|nr:AEC family transporter [Gracilinema caldarium]